MAKVTKSQPPKFDSNKSYRWKPEDTFEISGLDFDFLQAYFAREVANPQGVAPIDKVRGYNLMQDLLKNAVEQGVATEVPEEKIEPEDDEVK